MQGLIGHEVRIHSTSLARDLPGAVQVATTLTLAGKRVPHRAIGRRRTYRYHDRRVAKALRDLAGRIDVVHCWPRATAETAAAARRTGVVSVREAPQHPHRLRLQAGRGGARGERARARGGRPARLTEHLGLLDRDPETLARLRKRTLACREGLTWEQGARDLERLYRELLTR
jgi:hypothetical protein